MALINFNYFGSGGTHAGAESKTKRFKVAEDPEIKRSTKRIKDPLYLDKATGHNISSPNGKKQQKVWLELSKRGVR